MIHVQHENSGRNRETRDLEAKFTFHIPGNTLIQGATDGGSENNALFS